MKFLSSKPPEVTYVYCDGYGEHVMVYIAQRCFANKTLFFDLDEAKKLYNVLVHVIAEAQRRSEMQEPK